MEILVWNVVEIVSPLVSRWITQCKISCGKLKKRYNHDQEILPEFDIGLIFFLKIPSIVSIFLLIFNAQ
jgi:hypothetical protein